MSYTTQETDWLKNRITKNHDRIDKVLSLMNKGNISVHEAKTLIKNYSVDTECCVEELKKREVWLLYGKKD